MAECQNIILGGMNNDNYIGDPTAFQALFHLLQRLAEGLELLLRDHILHVRHGVDELERRERQGA